MRGIMGAGLALAAAMGVVSSASVMAGQIDEGHYVKTRPIRPKRRRTAKAEFYVPGYVDRSRYMPHQGKQEIDRRRRQRERLEAKAAAEKAMIEAVFGITMADEGMPYKPGISSAYGKFGVEIIPEVRMGMDVVISKKPSIIGEVQDSGNPIGKRVSWTSNGVQKAGEITHVVPAGKTPSEVGAKVKDAGGPRDHESFVVQANGKTYWPRVSLLNFE